MPILENAKHERFAREYSIDRNATQAAIRTGYSKRSAGMQGSRLLKDDAISARIIELENQYLKAADITAERVLEEIGRIAFAKTDEAVKPSDKNTALRMLAQRFKLIGSDADEALTNLAVSFADRVAEARQRRREDGKA